MRSLHIKDLAFGQRTSLIGIVTDLVSSTTVLFIYQVFLELVVASNNRINNNLALVIYTG